MTGNEDRAGQSWLAHLDSLFDSWLIWLADEKRASPHTLAAYRRDLKAFLDFVAGHLALRAAHTSV